MLPRPAEAGWRDKREALDRRLAAGMFRIHYATAGADAPMDDGGRLAAQLATQLERGHRFYAGQLGLTPPLANRRYAGVGAIDVHVLALDGKKGSTGDEPVTYRYRHFDDEIPVLSISISNRWQPGNLTPEHEVFHAYQYGYTFFKNAWFLEGLANALEASFAFRRTREEPLPQDETALRRVLEQSYGAGTFWRRVIGLCEPGCTWAAPDREAGAGRACGGRFVRHYLAELQAADRAAAAARGIDPLDWPEAEQRSDRNNPWLLGGLADTIRMRCPADHGSELAGFLGVLKAVGRSP